MPLDVWQTQAVLYDSGARVSSNSWDDSDLFRDQVQFYTQTAADFDAWLYAHEDFMAVCECPNPNTHPPPLPAPPTLTL